MSLSINEAIEQLTKLREQSKWHGNTAVMICFPETEYIEIESLAVENDPDGAVALICGKPLPDVWLAAPALAAALKRAVDANGSVVRGDYDWIGEAENALEQAGISDDYYPGQNISDRDVLHGAAESLDAPEAELWAAAINAVSFDPTLAGRELTTENIADLDRHLQSIRDYYAG